MKSIPAWQYDEFKHCGVDYADPAIAMKYDEKHERFRDYEKSAQALVETLGLGSEHTVIDLGCGTGAFALHAARTCKKVYAVDVSTPMLAQLKQKAEAQGLNNIVCSHAGFLTYEHADEPVDAIVSAAALHHIPDFWKSVALRRMAKMLKPGGRLHLMDVVFPSSLTEHAPAFDEFVATIGSAVGEDFAEEAVSHLRDEYSTFDWIIEGMLARAGFQVDSKDVRPMMTTVYLCTKKALEERFRERPVLRTKRLILRPSVLSDAADVQRYAGEFAVADTTLNIPHPYPDGLAEQWIATQQQKFEAGEVCDYAITLAETGQLIGGTSLSLNLRFDRAELGYAIDKDYWGQGYCTEAAGAMLDYAFTTLNLHKVQAHYFMRNPASGRVMQKIGMKYEGCVRHQVKKWDKYEDLGQYGILKEEWEQATSRTL